MTDEQPPPPLPEASDGHHCDSCGRVLVTVHALATAIHSGCALTGEHHFLEDCPSRSAFMLDATAIRKNLERQAKTTDP